MAMKHNDVMGCINEVMDLMLKNQQAILDEMTENTERLKNSLLGIEIMSPAERDKIIGRCEKLENMNKFYNDIASVCSKRAYDEAPPEIKSLMELVGLMG